MARKRSAIGNGDPLGREYSDLASRDIVQDDAAAAAGNLISPLMSLGPDEMDLMLEGEMNANAVKGY